MKILKTHATFIIAAVALIFSCSLVNVFASSPVCVYINNELIQYEDAAPQIMNDRVMVPFRLTAEKIGAAVDWNSETGVITLTKGSRIMVHKLGSNAVTVNGEEALFDTSSAVVQNRSMMPVRMLGEALGCQVDWNSQTKSVTVRVDELPVSASYSSETPITSDNIGGNTQTETSKEKFTSPKTRKVFTMPDKGFASIAYDGTEKTVPAEDSPNESSQYSSYDNRFWVYLDRSSKISLYFGLTENSSWEAGKTFALSDMQSDDNCVCVNGIYSALKVNAVYTNLTPGIFKDAQFTIIERNTSTGLMKWYFYVQISKGDTSYTFEGVAHTVRGEDAGSVDGSTDAPSSTGGGTIITPVTPGSSPCLVCHGKKLLDCRYCTDGFQMCPSCNGTGTYYSSTDGRIKECNRPGCRGGKLSCTRCNGTGYTRCTSCG